MKDEDPIAFVDVTWHYDQAASGPRFRAWLMLAEVIVYTDGDWEIRPYASGGQTDQHGHARNCFCGSLEALAMYANRHGQDVLKDRPDLRLRVEEHERAWNAIRAWKQDPSAATAAAVEVELSRLSGIAPA